MQARRISPERERFDGIPVDANRASWFDCTPGLFGMDGYLAIAAWLTDQTADAIALLASWLTVSPALPKLRRLHSTQD